MANETVAVLLHPGEMGAVIGSVLVDAGHEVRWVSAGRSEASRVRAREAGLRDHQRLADALVGADMVLSVVPPGSALAVARDVAQLGFPGLYLDANAVAPATMASIAEALTAAQVLDGGIVGAPPRSAGTTRLALSGQACGVVAGLFEATTLEPVIVGPTIGMASAFKQSFAAWTKGTYALALALDAYADAHGVGDALRAEWDRRGMSVASQVESGRRGSVPKAWRFDAEMDEIALAWDAAGVPSGFFSGAADLYRRLAVFKDRFDDPPELGDIRSEIRGS